MRRRFHSGSIACVLALALGCITLAGCASGKQDDAPLRSPSHDYPPPRPQTSDGQIVGADGVDPADRLEEGPKAGPNPGLAPGWTVDEHGVAYDPKRPAGAVDKSTNTEKKK